MDKCKKTVERLLEQLEKLEIAKTDKVFKHCSTLHTRHTAY